MKKVFIISTLLLCYKVALCQNCYSIICSENNTITFSLNKCSDKRLNSPSIQTNNDWKFQPLATDSTNNAYLIAELLDSDQDCFLVNFWPSDIESGLCSRDSVWILKDNIGIGLRRTGNNGIPLYNCPSYKAMHSYYDINTSSELAKVIEFKNGWLKIRFNYDRSVIVGWLAPENQCLNMYTMCMGE